MTITFTLITGTLPKVPFGDFAPHTSKFTVDIMLMAANPFPRSTCQINNKIAFDILKL